MTHQRGYWIIASVLKEAGFEVILGGDQLPAEVAAVALQEDVDVIGYRIMQGAPLILVRRLFENMQKQEIEDVPVVVGGIVHEKDEAMIRELGVREVFHPLSPLDEIVDRIRVIASEFRQRRAAVCRPEKSSQ
jgi:methylmalonyl-CoA mutase C-terminal domain/subunit